MQHMYASQFQRFACLSFLHLRLHNSQPAFHTTAYTSCPNALYTSTQSRLDRGIPPQQQQQRPRGTPHLNHSHQPVASTSLSNANADGTTMPTRRNGHRKDSVGHADVDGFSLGPSSDAPGGGGPTNTHGSEGPVQQQPPHSLINRLPNALPRPAQQIEHSYSSCPQQQHAMLRSQQHLLQSAPSVLPLQPLGTLESAKYVARTVKSLDFIGWNGELYVIVRNSQQGAVATVTASSGDLQVGSVGWAPVQENENDVRAGRASDGPGCSSTIGAGVVAPLTSSRVTTNDRGHPVSTTSLQGRQQWAHRQSTPPPSSCTLSPASSTTHLRPPLQLSQSSAERVLTVELKELPSRRRLDWGKGVDLGGEDAVWLEGKDVPMDYDMPVGSASGAGVEAS